MSIEAWVTAPDGSGKVVLDRSEASPFRNFAVSRTRGADPGGGSLQHHLDNELVAENPGLLDDGNLVWMRYRGRTMVWVIEERKLVLDDSEHATDWVQISGRGAKQLLADRIVLPTAFDQGANLDPKTWDAGAWKTKLDGTAASGQKVVPVVSTSGAVIGDPVQLTSSGNTELGIIASIVAGVSVTLVDDLSSTFASGSRIASAARQWRRFVNRAAGELLWDLISETNAFIVARGGVALLRGTIETTGADGWTQDLRWDNLLDVVKAVTDTHGDIDMDGLAFSYYSSPGVDRRDSVIFEEGGDLLKVERTTSDRDTVTWVVAEGVGEGVTAKLAVAEATGITRPRMAYVDAKDAGNLPLVQVRANAVIAELRKADSIGVTVTEDRFTALVDYDLHDTVRVIAPSRGVDASAVIVAVYLAESGEDRVEVSLDVNTPREEALLRLEEGAKSIGRSVGVRNRMPQGVLVPYSFGGGGVLDSGSPLYVFVKIPDRVNLIVEASVTLAFRQFLAPATAASSGGGSTSGSSSASSSSSDLTGLLFFQTSTDHSHGGGPSATVSGSGFVIENQTGTGNHSHSIPHTHSTPAHSHALDYGTFEEAFPASHSVTLRVYEREGSAWTLRGTFAGLTDDLEDVDLTDIMVGPGDWRLTVQSAGGQPQGGRLGCDVFGAITGAIQSE